MAIRMLLSELGIQCLKTTASSIDGKNRNSLNSFTFASLTACRLMSPYHASKMLSVKLLLRCTNWTPGNLRAKET